MKKSILVFVITAMALFAAAQDQEEYIMAMVKQIKAMKITTTEEAFQDLANNFERIANAETDKWRPLYYTAFCYVNMSFIAKDPAKKDSWLDNAQTYISKALEIYPEESELMVLQGLVYEARIQIDPVNRGQKFSMKATGALNKAKEFNPENPRAYYLLGLNILHTPESFGGGAKAACPILRMASEKFEKDIPQNVLDPTWGAEENQKIVDANCGSKE